MSKNKFFIFLCMSFFSILNAEQKTVVETKNPELQSKIEDKKIEDKKEGRKYNKPSGVLQITSPLGIKIFYKQDSSAPIVNVVIFFRNSGYSNQEKSKIGVPNLYLDSLFFGTEKYNENQFRQKLHDISAGCSLRVTSGAIRFSFIFPSIVLEESTDIFKDMICHPRFDRDKIVDYQNRFSAHMQDYSDISNVFRCFIPKLVFPKENIYSYGSYGSAEDYAKISIEDLKKYKSKYLVTSNAEACVCGDISEEKAKILIDKLLADLKKGNAAVDNVADTKPVITNVTKHIYAEGPQSTIIFVQNTEMIKSPDRSKAMVLAKILGGGSLFKSRLMDRLRTQLGLVYTCGISIVDCQHASGLLGILETDNKNVEKVIAEVRNVIKDLRTKGITEEELEFVKENYAGSALVGMRTSNAVCDFFSDAMMNDLGTDALNDLLNGIHAVSVDDVKKIAQKTLDENQITFVVIGEGNK